MKQVFSKNGAIVVEEVPAPTVSSGSVLVRTLYTLISAGTESSAIQSTSESLVMRALKNPGLVKQGLTMVAKHGVAQTKAIVKEAQENAELLALGYSACGEVVALGAGVNEFAIGDIVACAGAGLASHAEIISVPKNLVAKVPKGVDPAEAAFTTVGAIALQGVRRADNRIGEKVVVTGLGLIGQITVQLLRAAGCDVFGIDTNPVRVKLAKSFGMSGFALIGSDDPVAKVMSWTGGIGADAIIITAGTPSSEPAYQAMQMIRRKGKVVIVGAVGMDLKRSPFYEKEADFLISTSYGPGRYDPSYEQKGADYPIAYVRWTENRNMQAFLGLLAQGTISMKALTAKITPVDEAPSAYQSLKDTAQLPGVLLGYPDRPVKEKQSPSLTIPTVPAKVDGAVSIAVIGAGGFARAMHLPNLKKMTGIHLAGIADRLGHDIKRLAKTFGAQEATTDYTTLLKRADVDLAVIATRHNLHGPLTIEALEADKDVFVEKPLAMNQAELTAVIKAQQKSGRRVMVGFNRRFSPLSIVMHEAIHSLSGPMMMTVRVNAGPLPLSHWTNDPVEGGGRIIGEACHFLDYLLWFVGSRPLRTTVAKLGVEGINHQTNDRDNLVVTIEFADGSIGTLIYTTLGHSAAAKERFEVYRDNAVAILDDFKSLSVVGAVQKSLQLKAQDKGHFHEFELVRDAIQTGQDFPIPFEESVRATLGSFLVVEAAGTGQIIEGDWLPTEK